MATQTVVLGASPSEIEPSALVVGSSARQSMMPDGTFIIEAGTGGGGGGGNKAAIANMSGG